MALDRSMWVCIKIGQNPVSWGSPSKSTNCCESGDLHVIEKIGDQETRLPFLRDSLLVILVSQLALSPKLLQKIL